MHNQILPRVADKIYGIVRHNPPTLFTKPGRLQGFMCDNEPAMSNFLRHTGSNFNAVCGVLWPRGLEHQIHAQGRIAPSGLTPVYAL